MDEHTKVNVICDNLCLEEGMTKGQIIEEFQSLVMQATYEEDAISKSSENQYKFCVWSEE